MPRKPSNRPWLHSPSGYWCVTVDGRRTYLDKDYKVACRKLKALQAAGKRDAAGGREWLDARFGELADEFLSDRRHHWKPDTYTVNRARLLAALRILGTHLRVVEFRRFHLAKVERELRASQYSPSTIRGTLSVVQSVFNWAVEQELLDNSPVPRYRKPADRQRTRTITRSEFLALLRHSDPCFRRYLVALRLTGCRPGEIRKLIWEWVDLENGLWVIPEHKTIDRQQEPRPRIVPLCGRMLRMCRRLARNSHKLCDHVFLNVHGRPYSKDCVTRKMTRLRKRAGIGPKGGEQLVLYSNRHTFATEAAGRVSDIELAELMGHTQVRTTHRYVHLNADHLHDIRRRARG